MSLYIFHYEVYSVEVVRAKKSFELNFAVELKCSLGIGVWISTQRRCTSQSSGFVCRVVFLYLFLRMCRFTHMRVCAYIYLFSYIYLPVSLFIHPFICLSTYQSIYLFINIYIPMTL